MLYLREWREAAGLSSQAELASLCGMPQGSLSDIETRVTVNPGVLTLRRIVAGLNQRLPAPILVEDLLAPPPLPPPTVEEAQRASA